MDHTHVLEAYAMHSLYAFSFNLLPLIESIRYRTVGMKLSPGPKALQHDCVLVANRTEDDNAIIDYCSWQWQRSKKILG
jgi:hypothetical protein